MSTLDIDLIIPVIKNALVSSGVKNIDIVGHNKTFRITIELTFIDKQHYQDAFSRLKNLSSGNIDQFLNEIAKEINSRQSQIGEAMNMAKKMDKD